MCLSVCVCVRLACYRYMELRHTGQCVRLACYRYTELRHTGQALHDIHSRTNTLPNEAWTHVKLRFASLSQDHRCSAVRMDEDALLHAVQKAANRQPTDQPINTHTRIDVNNESEQQCARWLTSRFECRSCCSTTSSTYSSCIITAS